MVTRAGLRSAPTGKMRMAIKELKFPAKVMRRAKPVRVLCGRRQDNHAGVGVLPDVSG